MTDLAFAVREAQAEDKAFIVETTAKVRQPRELPWSEWKPYGIAWAEKVYGPQQWRLAPDAWVVTSQDVVLGFVMLHGRTLEMLYVKRDFRGLGLGRLLLDAAGFDDQVPCRAPTASWRHWCARRGITYTVIE